jgi:acetylornithine deacetylase/succinyl-diaminopimelate desuccinylase-like protein
MSKVAQKLGDYRARITFVPAVKQNLLEFAKESEPIRQAVTQMLQNPESADQILDMLAKTDKVMAEEIRARLRMTVIPTIIHGGVKENIVPSECEAVFDCRILPGQTPNGAMEEIKSLLTENLDKLEFETIQANDPSESSDDTPLYRLITDTMKEFDPTCHVAPVMLTGGTDSRFFRREGSVCYGFQPIKPDMPYGEMLKTVHGIDERISVANLVFGTSILYSIVERFMT